MPSSITPKSVNLIIIKLWLFFTVCRFGLLVIMITLSSITNYAVLYFIHVICLISILIFPINQNQLVITMLFQLAASIILYLCDILVWGDGLHLNVTYILCDLRYVFYPHVIIIQYHKKLVISSKTTSKRVSNCHQFSNLHILNSIQIRDNHLISLQKAQYFTAKTSNYLKITHLHISSSQYRNQKCHEIPIKSCIQIDSIELSSLSN